MRYSLNIVTVLLILLSNLAYADNAACYAPSPNLNAFGDAYYDLDETTHLSNIQQSQINAFFSAMSGKWKGNARQIECRGPDRAPRIITRDAIISTKNSLNSTTGLTIAANKNHVKERVKKTEQLSLLGNTPTFNLALAEDNRLIFAEKYRQLNTTAEKETPKKKSNLLSTIIKKITGSKSDDANKTIKKPQLSRITETIYDIKLDGGLLWISRAYYTNGVFIGSEQWNLSRD